MSFKDLGGFLSRLEEEGELRRVAVEADPVQEIAEITDRVSKSPSGGKALLFENVRGSAFPVVTNMFGSLRRICLALEVDELHELSRRMEGILAMVPAASPLDRLSALPALPAFLRYAPQLVENASCQEVVESRPDLDAYPVIKNFAGDGGPDHAGRFITLPLVFSCDPDTGIANCGMYRVELLGSKRVGIHWRDESGGAGHYRKYLARGVRMPVAVALGGDPAAIWAASAPLPENLEEMHLAGFLRREPVSMVRCLTSPLTVPAEAEMVIEGFLEPGETCRGGAFGNHSGFYAMAGDVPVLHVACITRRKGMIYPATVVGRPPMEDCFMAKATERLLLPIIRLQLPEVIEINMPMEGIFHGCAIVAVEKRDAGHPREVMEAFRRKGLLGAARFLVVVDADTNVHDLSLVAWRVLNLVHWQHDVVTDGSDRERIPLGRVGLDATRKGDNSTGRGSLPEEITRAQSVMELVDRRWREYGF
jgi:4-hydroxy-3-polyprenylbenzoate decarboxylase